MATTSAIAQITVRDALERDVTVTAPARRIVALAPHIVENLFAIGAGDSIIGAVQYSDYPEAAKAIPRVGGVGAISLERIAALSPDLVILWGSGTPPGLQSALERLSINYFVDEVQSLEELKQRLEALGRLTGRAPEAAAAVRRIDDTLGAYPLGESSAADRSSEDTNARAQPVFLQVWDQPLQSIGGAHMLSEVIRRCGGRSISETIPGMAPLISLEVVLAEDPRLIIVESEAQAAHWRQYDQLSAVQSDGIAVIHPDLLHRPTLRILQGMGVICERLSRNP